MKSSRKIELIEQRRLEALRLKHKVRFCDDFYKWHRDTEVCLEKIFGPDSRHVSDFKRISYDLLISTNNTTSAELQRTYVLGLNRADSILRSIIDEIEEYDFDDVGSIQPDAVLTIESICNRFHLATRQLRVRHSNKKTLEIEDEFDVQDLLHVFLTLHFDSVSREEPCPNRAGASSRIDFLLEQEEIGLEVKKTRRGLGAKEVGEQLIIDIERYKSHQSCKTLICFVYDPEGRIDDPRGLEKSLSKSEKEFKVIVLIRPKGT